MGPASIVKLNLLLCGVELYQKREATMAVTEKTDKKTKVEANYHPGFSAAKCGVCKFYRKGGACAQVEGEIKPFDVCDLYVPEETGHEQYARWNESDHPRADDGRFGHGGGGGGGEPTQKASEGAWEFDERTGKQVPPKKKRSKESQDRILANVQKATESRGNGKSKSGKLSIQKANEKLQEKGYQILGAKPWKPGDTETTYRVSGPLGAEFEMTTDRIESLISAKGAPPEGEGGSGKSIRTKAELDTGLQSWVDDYQQQRRAGNVKGAEQTKANIDGVIAEKELDAETVYGGDPESEKFARDPELVERFSLEFAHRGFGSRREPYCHEADEHYRRMVDVGLLCG